MTIESINIDKLISALNKYWRPVTKREFYHSMSVNMINNAIEAAEFPKHVSERIFKIKRKPFEIFKR